MKKLTLYQEPGYRVQRDKYGTVEVQVAYTDHRSVEYFSSLLELYHYWRKYCYGNRKQKLAINRKYAQLGQSVIAHYKELIAQEEHWIVYCYSWDGLGTACPHQEVREDGTPGCPIDFDSSICGYTSNYPPTEPLPGICPGPLNEDRKVVPGCLPSSRDEFCISMELLGKIRNAIT